MLADTVAKSNGKLEADMPSSVRDDFKGVEQIGANGGKTRPDEKVYSQQSELGEQKPTRTAETAFRMWALQQQWNIERGDLHAVTMSGRNLECHLESARSVRSAHRAVLTAWVDHDTLLYFRACSHACTIIVHQNSGETTKYCLFLSLQNRGSAVEGTSSMQP